MAFTDDDLKVLENWLDKTEDLPFNALPEGKLRALLSRLEAAEEALSWSLSLTGDQLHPLEHVERLKKFISDLDKWKKASGK